MTGPIHTYGPSCLLVDEPDRSDFQASSPPEIRSQFFYISALPIDDPLAPLPAPANQATGVERLPPKPFSARDNIALEAAWRGLGEKRKTQNAESSKPASNASTRPYGIAVPGHGPESNVRPRRKTPSRQDHSLVESRGSTLSNPSSVLDELPSRSHKSNVAFAPSTAAPAPAQEISNDEPEGFSSDDGATHGSPAGITVDRKRARSSSINDSSTAKRRSSSLLEPEQVDEGDEMGSLQANRSHGASMSGSPFIRAPISQPQTPLGRSFESTSSREGGQEWQADVRASVPRSAPKPSNLRTTLSLDQLTQDSQEDRTEEPNTQSKIPVGVSRLHLVELPNLKVSIHSLHSVICLNNLCF